MLPKQHCVENLDAMRMASSREIPLSLPAHVSGVNEMYKFGYFLSSASRWSG